MFTNFTEHISQASQFIQKDELRVCITSEASVLLSNLLYICIRGGRAGVLGVRVQLLLAAGGPSQWCPLGLWWKSRGTYSCWHLWSQGHVLPLQGHHGIIQGVACTHSAAEREILFPTTSDTWFARGRARDQERWWAGVVLSATSLVNQWLPSDSPESQQILLITKCEQQSHKPPDCFCLGMPKSTFQK